MNLVEKDCVYLAGDLTKPGFDCSTLKNKFGLLTCEAATGGMCEDWAVKACQDMLPTCQQFAGPAPLEKYKKKFHQEAKKTLEYCKNSYFTILDPGPDAKPKVEDLPVLPAAKVADVQGYDFHAALILQHAVKNQSELLTIADNTGEPIACPVPEFTAALPASYVNCLERKDLESAAWTKVRTDPRPIILDSRNVNHRIRKINGNFEIAVNIRLLYKGDPADRQEVVTKITNARSCVERFFARHRIILNLGLSTDDKSWLAWWNADLDDIYVSKYADPPNSRNWSIGFSAKDPLFTDSEICGTVIHELSHRLNLPDRYLLDAKNRKNYSLDKTAVMHDGNWLLPQAYFTEADLKILTNPLCKYENPGPP
ncbi:MAG TPA: hypothetical protein VNJ01_14170 [Bacteriovoracaceae bacterium]|nr:hypothetical protein [Bacteriovoracaceae bacterium]